MVTNRVEPDFYTLCKCMMRTDMGSRDIWLASERERERMRRKKEGRKNEEEEERTMSFFFAITEDIQLAFMYSLPVRVILDDLILLGGITHHY